MFRSLVVVIGLMGLLLVPTFVAADIPDLENHYTFDDPAQLALDSSGNERDGELDDTGGVQWVDDPDRGGVIEFPGNTSGSIVAELPEDGLPGDDFTIAFWAYRDSELCCGLGGGNDGLFQVQFEPFGPSTTTKVIGAWVQKSDAEIWGRIIQEDGATINQERGVAFMDDDEWVHLAYRGNGSEFEVVINGEEGNGPIIDYDGTLDLHDSIFIGRQGTETWGGRLDDFRVYSRALSNEEIAEVMLMDGGGDALLGDFNKNGILDADDMDLLSDNVRAGTNEIGFDLDNNGLVNQEDRRVWIEDLKNSYFGDSDLNGLFSSSDFIFIFTAGEYEDGLAMNSTWITGDWNGDREFDSSDFVTAFQGGGFEMGARPAVAAVPEPAAITLLLLAAPWFLRRRQR